MDMPSDFHVADPVQLLEDRRERARVVASFAEYLAEDLNGHSERALDAMASLAEWCEGDPDLLARARNDLARNQRRALRSAQAAIAQNSEDAIELLELVASAS
jgi:hypothetical protein